MVNIKAMVLLIVASVLVAAIAGIALAILQVLKLMQLAELQAKCPKVATTATTNLPSKVTTPMEEPKMAILMDSKMAWEWVCVVASSK